MREAIDTYKAGQKEEACKLFLEISRAYPEFDEPLIWLSATSRDADLALYYLEKAVAVNPGNGMACEALGRLRNTFRGGARNGGEPRPEPGLESDENEAVLTAGFEAESDLGEAKARLHPEILLEPVSVDVPEDTGLALVHDDVRHGNPESDDNLLQEHSPGFAAAPEPTQEIIPLEVIFSTAPGDSQPAGRQGVADPDHVVALTALEETRSDEPAMEVAPVGDEPGVFEALPAAVIRPEADNPPGNQPDNGDSQPVIGPQPVTANTQTLSVKPVYQPGVSVYNGRRLKPAGRMEREVFLTGMGIIIFTSLVLLRFLF